MASGSDTPMLKQYAAFKQQYPGTILLFRVGDFYETFGEDAVEAARVLGIVLTKRNNGGGAEMELAGFPHHALDNYLPRLVRAGKRVAVCDQLEDPKLAKGIVKRGVTEIATPGVTLNDRVLEAHKANYVAAVHLPDSRTAGLAFCEVSTGDFFCCEGDWAYAEKILASLQPAEVLLSKQAFRPFTAQFGEQFYLTRIDDWVFQPEYTHTRLRELLGTVSLKGFGVEEAPHGCTAAGVIVHYLHENQQKHLGHITRIYRFDDSEYVWLDRFTARNLELVQPLHPEGRSLAEVLDQTRTPMGARLLRRSLLLPLKNAAEIEGRLDGVAHLVAHPEALRQCGEMLQQMGDLERLAAKVATERLRPREAATLRASLGLMPGLRHLMAQAPALARLAGRLEDTQAAADLLSRYLLPEVSATLLEGEVINHGVSPELDDLRRLRKAGTNYLLQMQQREIGRTGITSLKVAFNKVFGYYIEVTNAHKHRVPEAWIRKQTLTNAERYITSELKEYEEKILSAEEKIAALEAQIYAELLAQLQAHLLGIQRNAAVIAELDMLASFAQTALRRHYARPAIDATDALEICQGRHPVIETVLPPDRPYIPNDVRLDCAEQQIIIITGPNMAGKSALLRQTALIVLMAQMGSFVPAQAARVGVVDKIFTRVGASDNLAGGESTFMVEMNETAQIANNATGRSLILLDEIGRGTSTYDGVSIAWALVEFLHNTPGRQAKTLFATHYHELNELEGRLSRVRNFNVSVREAEGRILFMRKLQPGGSSHSFGIHVAEMAGMPGEVVRRANELLAHFEAHRVNDQQAAKAVKFSSKQTVQLNMFELKDADTLRIRQVLAGVDVERMTPVEALLKLQEIQRALAE